MTAVAAGKIAGLAPFLAAGRVAKPRPHAVRRLIEADELAQPVDLHTAFGQPIDQQSLVFVLGQEEDVGIRTEAGAHLPEDGARLSLAADPDIGRERLQSALDDGVRDSYLVVELEGTCVDRERARRRTRRRRLVDDSYAHAEARQPQGQYEARRTGADDEHVYG